MAKYTTFGHVRDGKYGPYLKIDENVSLTKGMNVNIRKKPTDEDIANAKSEKQAEFLVKLAEKWPDWKLSELVLKHGEEE